MRWWLLVLMIVFATSATARDAPEKDLIHSDIPLYINYADLWPHSYVEPDAIGGCVSRVAFGFWRYHDNANDEYEGGWYRFDNYGVMHCAAIFSFSHERGDLPKANYNYGYFVKIGAAGKKELWALQMGTRPGSDYVLLSRSPESGIVKKFDVLQRACPKALLRDPPSLDIFGTRYCAVNSRADLVALARRMMKLPTLGTLTWVEKEPED